MISTMEPCVIGMVPAHVTSGSVLIDAWPTPVISAYHLVYSSTWTLVPAKPPLAPPSINDPIVLEKDCEHW